MAQVRPLTSGKWKVVPETAGEKNAIGTSGDLQQKVNKEYDTEREARTIADQVNLAGNVSGEVHILADGTVNTETSTMLPDGSWLDKQ